MLTPPSSARVLGARNELRQSCSRASSRACPETSWAQSCSRAPKQGEFAGHLLNEHLNELGAEPAMSLNEPSHLMIPGHWVNRGHGVRRRAACGHLAVWRCEG